MSFPNKFPKINQELLSQLRGLFFSKDNPVMLPNNGFIGLHSIDTPATLPPFPYRFLYVKADGFPYILDYEGNEYRLAMNITIGKQVGELFIWTTNTAPAGSLLCYGQAVSRTTYSALFAIIGTTFGVGDNSTTFNVPDMRGRIPLGQDDMGGTSANRVTSAAADTIGGAAGAETHTLQTTEMPPHNHYLDQKSDGAGSGNYTLPYASGTTYTNNMTTKNTGGGGAHNNMQPYLTINYCIYAGV